MSENSSSCAIIDGDVSFSNKDHLEWNQKKHNIMLNLGLTNNNSDTDQTPTPTRFIRNCEEVGLFQDLQNVNPFDEVFKKAVENPASVTKVTVSSSDDTLHTPQIYPQLEENSKCSDTTTVTISNDYSLNTVISSIEQEVDEGENPLIIALESDNNDNSSNIFCEKNNINTSSKDITSKKTCTDQTKRKVISSISNKTPFGVMPVPIQKLKKHDEEVSSNKDIKAEILRQREANKAAQTRCRKRKQREFEQMNYEIQHLRKENIRLTSINLVLQDTIKKLETKLKAAQSSTNGKSSDLLTPITSPEKSIESAPTGHEQKSTTCIHNQVKEGSKENSTLAPVLPNIKTLVPVPVQTLAMPVQNTSNSTVVVVYPAYISSQNYLSSQPVLTQAAGHDLNSSNKTNYKRIVPKRLENPN